MILRALPRRKRDLLFTSLVGVVFVIVAALLTWLLWPDKETYIPGEGVTGLTAALAREIPEDAPRIQFRDVTEQAGIAFRHFAGRRSSQLPEDMGSGVAWGDFDNDGWQDVYLVNLIGPITLSPDEIVSSSSHNHLYHNNGDGTFTEISRSAGVDVRAWGSGASWGDYNNDGFVDLIVTNYGLNRLFRNAGDGSFVDVSLETGIGGPEGFWAGASWTDYDRDGDLDLYITGYVRYRSGTDRGSSLQYDIESPASINPSAFEPERNLLYRNDGDDGFTEVAREAGVDNPEGRSLSAAWADFDDDGWPDLYVANDVSDNVFFRNNGDGTFDDVSHRAAVADYRGAMGIAVGDWDNDLDPDLFVTHWIAQENALYSNLRTLGHGQPTSRRPTLRFMDIADRVGLGQVALDFIGWGTSFLDVDNDGRLDLFVVNGSTLQDADASHLLVPMKDLIFWNGGTERGFFDVSGVAGDYFRSEHVGRGLAYADYDNDGDLDLLILNHAGGPVLLNNSLDDRNNWVQVELVGRESNRKAIGARVKVASGGGHSVRYVGAQPSYLSQNSPVAHFGIGPSSQVDTIEVRWPAGQLETIVNLAPNTTYRIVEGMGLVP